MSALVLQVLTGLASASALFLVASGLSLIFGVTRIVNFAHGSFYMLGLYGAVALTDAWGAGPLGFWGGVLVSALAVAALGALIEVLGPAPALLGARAVPAARDLRARPRHPRRGAARLGPGGPARPEGAGAEGRDRHPRQAVPELRRALDLHRPDRPRRALAAPEANPLGPARARRDAGPRDGRRPRRQPALAVHVGVRARHLPRRARRRAADAARAGQPQPRPRPDRRGLRGGRRRRHGIDRRRLRRRDPDRDGQGVLHRRRHRSTSSARRSRSAS